MSYAFDLIRLPAGPDRDQAHRQFLKEKERADNGAADSRDPGPLDPAKEERKQRIVTALTSRNPDLRKFERNYAKIAASRSVSEAEARRLFRDIELNDERNYIQINLSDDEGSIGFSPEGRGEACAKSVRTLWDCLRVLESEAGYAVYDLQLGKILDLESDYDTLVKNICSRD